MSATQLLNAEKTTLLKTVFFARNEPNVAFGNLSIYQNLPGLRGYWPMSSVDDVGDAYDLSRQGRTLTNNSATQFGVYNKLAPYMVGDGAADYLSRPDEAALDVTTMTIYAWVYFDALAADQTIYAKWGAAGQRSYRLYVGSTGVVNAQYSSNGTLITTNGTLSGTVTANAWYHIVNQLDIATGDRKIYVNGVVKSSTTGVIAVFNATSAFTIGATAVPDTFLDGRVAQAALCAAAHDDLTIQTVYHQTRAAFGL